MAKYMEGPGQTREGGKANSECSGLGAAKGKNGGVWERGEKMGKIGSST